MDVGGTGQREQDTWTKEQASGSHSLVVQSSGGRVQFHAPLRGVTTCLSTGGIPWTRSDSSSYPGAPNNPTQNAFQHVTTDRVLALEWRKAGESAAAWDAGVLRASLFLAFSGRLRGENQWSGSTWPTRWWGAFPLDYHAIFWLPLDTFVFFF